LHDLVLEVLVEQELLGVLDELPPVVLFVFGVDKLRVDGTMSLMSCSSREGLWK
jgi:hypothetical protein